MFPTELHKRSSDTTKMVKNNFTLSWLWLYTGSNPEHRIATPAQISPFNCSRQARLQNEPWNLGRKNRAQRPEVHSGVAVRYLCRHVRQSQNGNWLFPVTEIGLLVC